MNSEFRKQAIIAALNHRVARPEDLARLDAAMNAKTDWYATCQKCKMPVRGTLAQIKEHKCGEQS